PRIDRLLLGGLSLRRAALAALRLGGLVVRTDVVVLVARVLAVLRAPRIERGDHVVDVTRLAVDAGDRPLRAILLAAVRLDLHVLVVERDGALEVAADLGGVRGVVERVETDLLERQRLFARDGLRRFDAELLGLLRGVVELEV